MNADDFKNKKYKVEATFHVSGMVPPRFSVEDLKKAIENALGEMEQDSELYDDKEYYHWATFADECDMSIEEYEVDFVEEMSCEHCGSMHDYYGPRIYVVDSGISWCGSCGDSYLSESEKKWIKKEGKKFKKKLIKKKIEDLQNELSNL